MLITKELEKKLNKYPIGSQDGLGEEAEVLVKYFNPCRIARKTWCVMKRIIYRIESWSNRLRLFSLWEKMLNRRFDV